MRRRRGEVLLQRFPDLADMEVLDLGGEMHYWTTVPVPPRRVTVVNIRPSREVVPDFVEEVVGDACAPPPEVTGREWDLVHSNSVIEHVGGHTRRQDFAAAVRALAPAHWIQTPNRYFPVEPHWLFPGFQFLPARTRRSVAVHWPFHVGSNDPDVAAKEVLDIELLSRFELAWYFPDSEIVAERVAGMAKSFVAVSSHR